MKFFITEDGYPSLDISNDYHVLADFLKDDIQRSLYGVDEYIQACESVRNGSLSLWEGTGNSHTVTIKPVGVEIFNEYTEESINILSIEEFENYLKKWKELLLIEK
ncbi:hypothetical protein F157LOC_03222 [Pectobacterium brasiliense]|uniref:hypothetical protein n=1 Tax=Pectobacterium brasiliense TaxID=180957 RepID=UPI000CE68902|nr:hypothetical protein [Pectobacterium brasiliense]PPE58201.1 hypothetical protein F157LOC_03222 [Pectobacterium brasiliense]